MDPTRTGVVRRGRRRGIRWRKLPGGAAKYAILVSFAAIAALPLLWVVVTSLKTTREVAMSPMGLPTVFRWQNYVEAWGVGRFGSYFLNSIIVSVPIVVITVVLSCLAGYALARLRVTGGQVFFYVFLVGLMVPFQSVMIPLFYILRDVRLLGTYWAMILPMVAIGLPLGVFLMRAFFLGLSSELADAAKMDGCSEFGVFWRIMLPLATPGISTLAVLQFIAAWKEFLIPLLYLQREELRPLVLGLMFFKTAYTRDIPLTMAATGIVMLPIVLVYLLLQRKFIQGITAGAVKG